MSRCLMACAFEGKVRGTAEEKGILADHAYGILELRQVHSHRLVRLRVRVSLLLLLDISVSLCVCVSFSLLFFPSTA